MAALAANNTDLKNRRIAVTMVDRRVAARKYVRGCLVLTSSLIRLQ